MTHVARFWLPLFFFVSVTAFPLVAQDALPAQPSASPAQPTVSPAQPTVSPAQPTVSPAQPPASPAQHLPSPQPEAVALQQLLDRDDYIAYSLAMSHVDVAHLTESQHQYFLGMLAFHAGKLDAAGQMLLKGVDIKDKSLTGNQVESALETLGQIDQKLAEFGAAAQMYDDVDKAFGAQLGARGQTIREIRHLAALLEHVAKQTVEISGDFTLPRTGLEYPVSIPQQPPGKQFSTQLDTGAEISVLSASTAKAWGVMLLEGSAKLHGIGGGSFPAQPGFIPTLIIGKAEFHNVAVYVAADENLYTPQIKRQTNALLGYPVVAALGRLTFAKDGSLTVSAESPARDLNTDAALWLGDHSLLVGLGTQPVVADGKLAGATGTRLFMLDTGAGGTLLTDHYLAEHTDVFNGPPPAVARLAGADGLHEIPAYAAQSLPLFAGGVLILLNGQRVLTQPVGGEVEHFFGLVGQDILGLFGSYTIDFRNMTFSVTP